MVNYKHQYEQVKKMLSMYQDEIVPGMMAKIEELESHLKELESNEPLTLEELRQMDGEPVWITFVSPTDTCPAHWRIWNTHEYQPCELEACGTVWMAYRRKPYVAPVRSGEWLICCDGYYPYCSKCGEEPYRANNRNLPKFCPNCGARMDGE